MSASSRPLRFEPDAGSQSGTERIVVLDPSWTPSAADSRITIRDPAERILAARDLYDEAAVLLNDWADKSGIVEILTVEGSSLWYQVRLAHWWWLQERLLWLGVLADLIAEERPSVIRCPPGTPDALVGVVRLLSEAEQIPAEIEPAPLPITTNPARGAAKEPPPRTGILGWLDRFRGRREREARERQKAIRAERLAEMVRRVDRAAGGPRPLVVLMDHRRQLVETESGRREINPYIQPILDELSTKGIDFFEIETRGKVDDTGAWHRASEDRGVGLFLGEGLLRFARSEETQPSIDEAESRAERIRAINTPLIADGVDLGPELIDRLVTYCRRSLPARIRDVARIRRLLERLQPIGLLLADEYQRQEWLIAARDLGIPTAAIQHGGIQRRHLGYIHNARRPELTLPDRTYVFGDWERRLLVDASVYEPSEVVVAGSPRLDIVRQPEGNDRLGVRQELGVEDGHKLVVVSTTWGDFARRFHFPIALARLFDRPMPGVHLVVKLHPTEPDDGLYRRVVEGAARAHGYPPPVISVVQKIDLYRLLSAADAHLGLYSTVITEAVFTGTPNLLAQCTKPHDLLGYVEAGVAVPVRDGGELQRLLEDPRSLVDEARRAAFVRDHFEPGNASRRISEDLLQLVELAKAGSTVPRERSAT